MVVGFLFSMTCLGAVLWKMLHISDPAILTVWADHFRDLGGVLLGLVSIPYAANKASGSVTEIIAAIKKRD